MRPIIDTHLFTLTNTLSLFIMSFEVAVQLLALGNNGEEILSILDDILPDVYFPEVEEN